MKECKRHKWRVGAKTNCIIHKSKVIPTKLVIWCEKCGKKIKANIYCDWEMELFKKKVSLKHTEANDK